MRFPAAMVVVGAALFATLAALAALAILPSAASADQQSALVARGRYLVMDAGKCSDCHGANLHGSHLGFLAPNMPVKYDAPQIAGLPQLSAADAATFLQTGNLPGGKHASPPMPEYRFNRADATAIAAFLKSLH